MATLMMQSRTTPEGGKVVYAWDVSEPEAFCYALTTADPADAVIVAGTGRCFTHSGAEAPCPVAYRTPGECRHPIVESSADLVRCTICGHESVEVPEHITLPPEPPAVADDDHSSLGAPEVS